MSEKEVKKAFNAIEPEDGAQERMYANILKKRRHSARLLWRGTLMRPRRKATRPQRPCRSPPAARRHGGSGTARWLHASRW